MAAIVYSAEQLAAMIAKLMRDHPTFTTNGRVVVATLLEATNHVYARLESHDTDIGLPEPIDVVRRLRQQEQYADVLELDRIRRPRARQLAEVAARHTTIDRLVGDIDDLLADDPP